MEPSLRHSGVTTEAPLSLEVSVEPPLEVTLRGTTRGATPEPSLEAPQGAIIRGTTEMLPLETPPLDAEGQH